MKLAFYYQYNLEYKNNQLGKQVMKLERVNDECHCCIRKLLSEVPASNECDCMKMSNVDHSMKDLKNELISNEKMIDNEFTESF